MNNKRDYDLSQIESSNGGLDAFFASDARLVTPPSQKAAAAPPPPQRVKVGSLDKLNGFQRISSDTLVHKSTNDLWALRQDGGSYFIERLFQDNGQPLKG